MTECATLLSSNLILEDMTSSSNKIPFNNDHIDDKNMSDSENENEISFSRIRSKLKQLTDSDSDPDKEINHDNVSTTSPQEKSSDEESSKGGLTYKKKSRIKNILNSDSESQSEHENKESISNYDLSRTKIKNRKLHDKFKQFKNPVKSISSQSKEWKDEKSNGDQSDNESSKSSDEETSCLKIKQNLQKSSQSLAICDPDTSDEESAINVKQKSRPKYTKPTSPKAVRMSAKQAMENMQKIKSESNRMLREKEVSLPYHRPKALTLKDIMSRRKPALSSDGKSLPIKMNSEQLRQYASLLEQRQKEMMELCKSDTDNEDENCSEEAVTRKNDLNASSISINKPEETESDGTEIKNNEENRADISHVNDKTFDDICMEQNINESNSNNSEMQNAEEQIDINDAANEVEQPKSNVATASNHTAENKEILINEDYAINDEVSHRNNDKQNTEEESQVISLHYDTDKTEVMDVVIDNENKVEQINKEILDDKENLSDEFSDNDFTVEDLEKIIENAELNKDTSTKPLSHLEVTLAVKPKITGAPGMVIDLDNDGSSCQSKLTGVELLKERFKYFAKLKSLEDKENDREKKFKPGVQHLKLKQELEEQIAEQRSLEWEKRIEEENKLKAEMNEIDGVEGEGFDGEDIEKIEAKLEENDNVDGQEEESSSEEEIENDIDMTEKPRKRNPMVDDEAEVSEDENGHKAEVSNDEGEDNEEQKDNEGVENDSDSEDNDSESSDSEQEEEKSKPRKGRILKAFEDSDDEGSKVEPTKDTSNSQDIRESQDDDIQLAQLQKSYSEDLFTSQECSQKSLITTDKPKDIQTDTSLENDLGTQTFSILNTDCNNSSTIKDNSSEKLDIICGTQPYNDNFDALVGMCTGKFAEHLVTPEVPTSQLLQSQEIGDDVVALCTGKFYDNPLVSQSVLVNDNGKDSTADDSMNEEYSQTDNIQIENTADKSTVESASSVTVPENQITGDISKQAEVIPGKVNENENKVLKSILDELDDPEFDSPKPKKYFFSDSSNKDKEIEQTKCVENTQLKKKFVIESDDETNDNVGVVGKKKKRKKRRLEDRALQISDDEEDESEHEEETYESDIEEDNERLVEYDSEENEVEVQANPAKKKRMRNDFFEQEAELTSEDEWIGSGDEDEAGLDRMEREAGDDDTFHEGKLQRELGEIHMREVLDQDKREVRLLQELLFEDGDLGDGHRQRKFRWKNAVGEEEMGTNADEYADTQEDEFESEEQWRKQRHERVMFLRKLQEQDEEDANVSINRSALIKANLSSKTTPSVADKAPSNIEKPTSIETEKKAANDVHSPKKPYMIFQQSFHNSLLTRGRGALARLAALATPLAGDGEDAPKVNTSSTRGNFVFAAITPDVTEPKITKRKADANPDTPRLLKKMRKDDLNKNSKISLLDHL